MTCRNIYKVIDRRKKKKRLPKKKYDNVRVCLSVYACVQSVRASLNAFLQARKRLLKQTPPPFRRPPELPEKWNRAHTVKDHH